MAFSSKMRKPIWVALFESLGLKRESAPPSSSFWMQLQAFLWKNYLIKRRNMRDKIIEILVPTLITALAINLKNFLKMFYKFVVFFLEYVISGNCCWFTLS